MNKLYLPLLLILLLFACSGSNDEISEIQKPLESSVDEKKPGDEKKSAGKKEIQ